MRWFPLLRKRIFKIIVTVIMFLLGAAVSGIIGNAVYATFVTAHWETTWEWLSKPLAVSPLFLIVGAAAILAIFAILLMFILVQEKKTQEKKEIPDPALDKANKIIGLDDSLLRLLASLDPTKDVRSQTQQLLEDLLKAAIKTLPDKTETYRASICLHDTGKKYLKIRVHEGIPDKTIERSEFYIGPDRNLEEDRGVAGTTYITQKLMAGHIIWKEGRWVCDIACYKQFTQDDVRPSYNSFVCVPIVGLADESLGVICFDSHSSTVFDSIQVQSLLQIFSTRVAVVMLIYFNLSQPHQPPITTSN